MNLFEHWRPPPDYAADLVRDLWHGTFALAAIGIGLWPDIETVLRIMSITAGLFLTCIIIYQRLRWPPNKTPK